MSDGRRSWRITGEPSSPVARPPPLGKLPGRPLPGRPPPGRRPPPKPPGRPPRSIRLGRSLRVGSSCHLPTKVGTSAPSAWAASRSVPPTKSTATTAAEFQICIGFLRPTMNPNGRGYPDASDPPGRRPASRPAARLRDLSAPSRTPASKPG
ncbi:MAG: hypothetical protein EXR94_10105 [Gemmatimonadetes bacterium]|nr:hypothetical protein [Gemmatimonadota bacterium]